MSELLLDAAGRRRSPATLPDFHAGRPPRNKGIRYPADPPTIEEIIAVMRTAGDGVHGRRLRGLIVVLWRAGLRIHEALALTEADLDARRGSLLVRRGKGWRRREVGMDDWAFEQLAPWLETRVELLNSSWFYSQSAEQFQRAEFAEWRGRQDVAIATYGASQHSRVLAAPAAFAMARLYEMNGDSQAAIREYRRVAYLWARAESDQAPLVKESRRRLAQLRAR